MPLRALLSGKDFDSEYLTEANRKGTYICPICKMRLVPVIPIRRKIKHFRHPKGGLTHYEPETEEHLNGKKRLKEIAAKLGLSAQTEVAIGNHVTDVLIDGDQPLAIEFQCSKCNSRDISERTETYWENKKATLWVLGKKFIRDFHRGRKTYIENEIEGFHPTIYFADDRFIICRRTPKYYDYYRTGSSPQGEKPLLVEEFDIEWHLRHFITTKLEDDNPSLTFKWTMLEEPKEEQIQESTERKESKDDIAHYIPINEPTYQPQIYTPSKEGVALKPWLVKEITSSEVCDDCLKHRVRYKVNLQGSQLSLKRCENCFEKLKKRLPNSTWANQPQD